MLPFRVLGSSFSSFGCFVSEIWVLRASSASFSKLPIGWSGSGMGVIQKSDPRF